MIIELENNIDMIEIFNAALKNDSFPNNTFNIIKTLLVEINLRSWQKTCRYFFNATTT